MGAMQRKVTILKVPGSNGRDLCGGGRPLSGSGGGETGLCGYRKKLEHPGTQAVGMEARLGWDSGDSV